MGLTLNIDPDGLKVTEIPGPPDEQGEPTIAARVISCIDAQSGIAVSLGPFVGDVWDSFLAYLTDPKGEEDRQRIREKLTVVGNAPKMAIPKGT